MISTLSNTSLKFLKWSKSYSCLISNSLTLFLDITTVPTLPLPSIFNRIIKYLLLNTIFENWPPVFNYIGKLNDCSTLFRCHWYLIDFTYFENISIGWNKLPGGVSYEKVLPVHSKSEFDIFLRKIVFYLSCKMLKKNTIISEVFK